MSAVALRIKDRPGIIAVADIRRYFERSIRDTSLLRDKFPIDAKEKDGAFSHYSDPKTDTFWIGFALGMRCAERLAKEESRS